FAHPAVRGPGRLRPERLRAEPGGLSGPATGAHRAGDSAEPARAGGGGPAGGAGARRRGHRLTPTRSHRVAFTREHRRVQPLTEPLPRLPLLPRRLRADAPSWTETTDVCVIGSGVAGLTCALNLRRAGFHVTVVTKVHIDDGSTRWAQGGVAAVLDPLDTPEAHARDTQIAGVGLCDPAAVDVTVTEGPGRIADLVHLGTEFDRHADGSLQLTREGGHRARRIVHAGGDATGAEIQRALHAAVLRDPWIRIIENAMVLDLLVDHTGHAAGVSLHVLGEGVEHGVGGV